MPATEILNNLKENKIAPIYFLQGEEPYYIDKVSDYIEDNLLNEADKSFNLTIMYGRDCKMHEVLTNARRFPMMSERQVVIVKEAHHLQDFKNEEGRALLDNYIDNPLDSTVLVFCHKYGKLNGNYSLAKKLKKNAIVLDSARLKDYQVADWITRYITRQGYGISQLATQLIADHIGNNLERLSNEIDKLLINHPKENIIDEETVEKNIGISKDYSVFELQNAIIKRDALKANRIVKYFAANQKEHPIILTIAMLYAFFNKILLAHQSKDKSPQGMAKVLKVNPYFVKDYLTAVRNYPLFAVKNKIRHIHEADMAIKGVDAPTIGPEGILKQLVFKLIH